MRVLYVVSMLGGIALSIKAFIGQCEALFCAGIAVTFLALQLLLGRD